MTGRKRLIMTTTIKAFDKVMYKDKKYIVLEVFNRAKVAILISETIEVPLKELTIKEN